MKKILGLVLALGLLAGCESERRGEKCVGFLDQKKPGVEYALSGRNIVVGFIFSETLIVPAVVVLAELECPVWNAPVSR